MDGWMDGRMDGLTDGWMVDNCTSNANNLAMAIDSRPGMACLYVQ